MAQLKIKQAPKATILFKDVHIFDPVVAIDGRGDLLVEGGKIARISLGEGIEGVDGFCEGGKNK